MSSTDSTPPPAPAAEPEKKRYFTAPTDSPANDFSPETQAEPLFTGAVKRIKLEDFTKVHLQPCARESLLSGIGIGFVVGGLRFVVGGNVPRGCNWAVGSFVVGSLLSYEACMYKRRVERDGMARAAQIMEIKRKEIEKKRAAMEELKAQKMAEEAAKKSWWKVW